MTSCQPEFDGIPEAPISNSESISYWVEEGMLVFSSREVYEETLTSLSQLSDAELDVWEKSLADDFRSMRTAFSQVNPEELIPQIPEKSRKNYQEFFFTIQSDRYGELELIRPVDSDALASVLNDKGLVKIEDRYYFLTFDFVYEFKKLPDLSEGIVPVVELFENDLNVRKYPISREIQAFDGSNFARVGTCSDEYRRRWRVRGELWVTNTPPLYSGAGARAKHQRRRFGIWWARKADRISLDVDGEFSQTAFLTTATESVDFTQIRYDKANIQWVWNECFNVACSFDADARVEVEGRYDGKGGSCVIP